MLREATLEKKLLQERIASLAARHESQREAQKLEVERLLGLIDAQRRTIETLLVEKKRLIAELSVKDGRNT